MTKVQADLIKKALAGGVSREIQGAVERLAADVARLQGLVGAVRTDTQAPAVAGR